MDSDTPQNRNDVRVRLNDIPSEPRPFWVWLSTVLGMSGCQIARCCGVSQASVYRALKEAREGKGWSTGPPLMTPSEARAWFRDVAGDPDTPPEVLAALRELLIGLARGVRL